MKTVAYRKCLKLLQCDEHEALADIDFVMRNFAFSKNPLTPYGMKLAKALRDLVKEWQT